MILNAFTVFHVLLSLAGIGTGFVVLYGMLTSKPGEAWTSAFLWTTVATSVTGFMFPVHQFLPSHATGILSLLVLAIAIPARKRFNANGDRRRTYIISSMIALYFNMFVLIVQSFLKVPALHELAPTQSEPPFLIAQLLNLILFVALTTRALAAS